jgi:glycosyltransferase involved in cell wall biosynthesis
LRNALYFLTEGEEEGLDPALQAKVRREAVLVHLAARRSDVIVAPCTAMAERIAAVRPELGNRVVVRPHPVSDTPMPRLPREPVILCPVLFSPYKRMAPRLTELLTAVGDLEDPAVRVRVTAHAAEVPAAVACHPQVELVGRLPGGELREMQARSRAIYFPTGLESFGYPLAEARVSGRPVIARDTAQNREIAGLALCGYTLGDRDSLRHAIQAALTADVAPDPGPFDPDRYFGWLLGEPR